jgi:hypothetical protein
MHLPIQAQGAEAAMRSTSGFLIGLGALAGFAYLLLSNKSSAAPLPGGGGTGAPPHLMYLPGRFVEIPESGEIVRIVENRGEDLVLEQAHTGLKLPVLFRKDQVRPVDVAEYPGANQGDKVAYEYYPYAPGVRALKFGVLSAPNVREDGTMGNFTVRHPDGTTGVLGVGQPVWRVR